MGEKYEHLMRAFSEHKKAEVNIINEAPILISCSTIVPDLIADAGKEDSEGVKEWRVIFPEKWKGYFIRVRDKHGNPTPFNQDPVLRDIFPEIDDSLPFRLPSDYPDWQGIAYSELEIKD